METKSTDRIRGTNGIDKMVGGNVRRIRKMRGVPQAALAEAVGVSFQQLQKYELATNRISASKLYDIAQFFNVPISVFFAGTNDTPAETFQLMLAFDPAIYELGKIVSAIPSQRTMRSLIRLARQLSVAEADLDVDDEHGN